MKYDFDKIINRDNTFSVKYEERIRNFGTNDLIPLWIADMDFETAKPITEAIKKRAAHGIYGYVSKPDSFFQAFCNWQSRRNNWDIDRNLVSFSPGVVPSLSVIVNEFTDINDKVLIQTPVYPEFYDVVEAWDRIVLENKLLEKDGVYSVDFEDFENKLKHGTKLFILCNPQNPVGRVWSMKELQKMTDLCNKYNVLIASDEIHADLMLWGNRHIPTATVSEKAGKITITCTSCSKTFNLAGLQASFAVFPDKNLKDKFDKFWKNLEIHRNNCFSIVAMETAYSEGEEWLKQLIPYLENNINYVREFCKANIPQIKPSKPESTYLVWLDCRDLGLSNEELNDFMINKAHLGLNSGNNFSRSLSGYMRMNIACPRSVLEKAMKQLDSAVNNLNGGIKSKYTRGE
ncbi:MULTISPECIES: MalY/PatB family protein [unclassified Sedimentibacter]|uniref:MalY/PatB family protein n=1 Tax=unclassified Sedimentibacter TaxID=2649220 RepID=UPI0027E0C829|nr:MalY/PatB family protein [Sedimentibacter sp. MB35-C1]WMJ77704.1 MalY/PatB family protein [Sedimentibacter sp. MB35-C1]